MTTPQQLGREWETEVAELTRGSVQPGSGNRIVAKLDTRSGLLVVSAKHTIHDSYRLTVDDFEEALSFAVGPMGSGTDILPIMALKVGQRQVGVLDLQQLLDLIKAPPAIIPSTKLEDTRATARTNSLLR